MVRRRSGVFGGFGVSRSMARSARDAIRPRDVAVPSLYLYYLQTIARGFPLNFRGNSFVRKRLPDVGRELAPGSEETCIGWINPVVSLADVRAPVHSGPRPQLYANNQLAPSMFALPKR